MASEHFGPQHWRKSSQWFSITRPAGGPHEGHHAQVVQCCSVWTLYGLGSMSILGKLHSASQLYLDGATTILLCSIMLHCVMCSLNNSVAKQCVGD
jgi:hypothetical protein